MNDKTFSRFLFFMLVLFLLWWMWHRHAMRNSANQAMAPTPFGNPIDPETLTYEANPGAFGPQRVDGSINLNYNVPNGLNQNYIPLFGFVGMAQGEIYQ